MQEYYRVPEEKKDAADKVLVEAAKKLARQMQYESKFVAMSTYYGHVCNEKMTKKRMKDENVRMPKEHFMDVSNMSFIPGLVVFFHHAHVNGLMSGSTPAAHQLMVLLVI